MIAIYEDMKGDLNPDDFEPTALYDGNRWIAGGEEWEEYYPDGTPETVIAEQLSGPSPVVVEVTGGSDELRQQIEKQNSSTVSTGSSTLGVGDDVEIVDEDDEEANEDDDT